MYREKTYLCFSDLAAEKTVVGISLRVDRKRLASSLECLLTSLCFSDLEAEKTVVGISLRVDRKRLASALEMEAGNRTNCILTGR